MTAILRELRSLDEQLARQDITDVEYLAQRSELIDSVDVVEPVFVETKAAARGVHTQHSPPNTSGTNKSSPMSWSLAIIICLVVVGVCLCLAMLIFADFNLALTLGVTVLAALSVALLHSLEE